MMYNDRLRVVVDEIRKTIRQVMDDSKITPAQVAYWIRISANKLLAQHISKRSSGAFINTFDGVPVLITNTSKSPDFVKQRKFFQLPAEIFDFDGDRGIEYVSYVSDGGPLCPPRLTQVTFTRTTQKQSHWLYKHQDTTPSPSNPYFYRAGHNIYLLGIEKVNVPYLEIGLYTAIDPIEILDTNYDAPFIFPAELMETLKASVIAMARYSFLFPKESRANEGSEEPDEQQQTVQKIASVNQNQQQTE